jgi:hypothetical protein
VCRWCVRQANATQTGYRKETGELAGLGGWFRQNGLVKTGGWCASQPGSGCGGANTGVVTTVIATYATASGARSRHSVTCTTTIESRSKAHGEMLGLATSCPWPPRPPGCLCTCVTSLGSLDAPQLICLPSQTQQAKMGAYPMAWQCTFRWVCVCARVCARVVC